MDVGNQSKSVLPEGNLSLISFWSSDESWQEKMCLKIFVVDILKEGLAVGAEYNWCRQQSAQGKNINFFRDIAYAITNRINSNAKMAFRFFGTFSHDMAYKYLSLLLDVVCVLKQLCGSEELCYILNYFKI